MQRSPFRTKRWPLSLTATLLLLLLSSTLKGMHNNEETKDTDLTLSPYFFIVSDDPAIDQMPLKSTAVKVNISGVIADVTVKQIYQNQGKKALEALYTFPASTRAAVYGMTMSIGERTIVAKIDRREQARQSYEQARQQGQSASLLEQQRPNVFQMNVANIMPGDSIEVELKYTELLVPENGQYEFVYPTVVGPRYSNVPGEAAIGGENWVANPYLHADEQPTSTLKIEARLQAGMPIQQLSCVSHSVDIGYSGKTAAQLSLSPEEQYGGNRDFILRYQLAGQAIESGLLLHRGADENHFLLMLEPPERVNAIEVTAREYIFIVDVSGSMHGFPLDVSKALLRELIGKLRPGDHFNVLLFASSSEILSAHSLPANQANIDKALQLIGNQRGGGGTEILPALQRALALPRAEEAASRTIIIATDGYVRVEPEVLDLIRKNLGTANLFAFGIGKSVNRHLIEGMAHAGMGEPFVMTSETEARRQAKRFAEMVQSPVLTQVQIDFGQFDAYDIEPLSVPDVLAQRPVLVFGKWRGKARGIIRVNGHSGKGRYEKKLVVQDFAAAANNSALRYLWARHRLKSLADYNLLKNGHDNELIEQITSLGLHYNLLSAYTSFVAIDSEVRNADGHSTQIKQPLPMPEGVSNLAIAGGFAPAGIQMLKKGNAGAAPVQSAVAFEREATRSLDAALPEMAPSDAMLLVPGSLKIAKISIQGALSETEIRAEFEQHRLELGRVLQEISRTRPNSGLKLVIELKINRNGKVSGAQILNGSANLQAIEKQIIGMLVNLRFPSKSANSTAKITLTF
ncbi:MAG: VWA domain-containing protein [Deferribacteres bacterium]|nr:VWA domain-containing protein [Deferribacteres bacterium]